MIRRKEKAPSTAATVQSAELKVQFQSTTECDERQAYWKNKILWMLNKTDDGEILERVYCYFAQATLRHFISKRGG